MDSIASRINVGEIEHLKAKVIENHPDRMNLFLIILKQLSKKL
jgi:hypothetical protein